ncbi:unnamed protein product [Closterium sp. NIES-54]
MGKFMGKWYEIGATALGKFQSKGELGIASITYTYSTAKNGKSRGALSLTRQGVVAVMPMRRSQVAAISAATTVLAQQLRAVCGTVSSVRTKQQLSTSYLTLGSEELPVDVKQSVSYGLGSIEGAVAEVSRRAEALWAELDDVQRANAQLNQRDSFALVARMKIALRSASSAIQGAAKGIDAKRNEMFSIAAMNRISLAMANVMTECQNGSTFSQRVAALASATRSLSPLVSSLFSSPSPALYTTRTTATATLKLTSEAGKMIQQYQGVQTDHWVIGLWGNSAKGYSHALVYSCYQSTPGLSSDQDGQVRIAWLAASPLVATNLNFPSAFPAPSSTCLLRLRWVRVFAAMVQRNVKVAVAVDGSDNSMHALREAVRLFARTAKEFHIMHAHKPPNEFRTDSLFSWQEYHKRMEHERHTKAQQLLQKCAAVVREEGGKQGMDEGVAVSGVNLKGDPRDVLASHVQSVDADLMVMGTRGMSLLKRMALGSVSSHCVHHAPCPVLVVPLKADAAHDSVSAPKASATQAGTSELETHALSAAGAIGPSSSFRDVTLLETPLLKDHASSGSQTAPRRQNSVGPTVRILRFGFGQSREQSWLSQLNPFASLRFSASLAGTWQLVRDAVPCLDWLLSYDVRRDLKGDMVAGLSVGFMIIPQGMAYARVAGLPSIYGLYTGFVPCLVYSIFGSSRQLALGPTSLVSLLVNEAIKQMADPDSHDPAEQRLYLGLTLLLSLMLGALQLLAGLLRLGWVVRFLSHAVVSGFSSGAAIMLGLMQMRYFLGYTTRHETMHMILYDIFVNLKTTHVPSLVMGVLALAFLLIMKLPASSFRPYLGACCRLSRLAPEPPPPFLSPFTLQRLPHPSPSPHSHPSSPALPTCPPPAPGQAPQAQRISQNFGPILAPMSPFPPSPPPPLPSYSLAHLPRAPPPPPAPGQAAQAPAHSPHDGSHRSSGHGHGYHLPAAQPLAHPRHRASSLRPPLALLRVPLGALARPRVARAGDRQCGVSGNDRHCQDSRCKEWVLCGRQPGARWCVGRGGWALGVEGREGMGKEVGGVRARCWYMHVDVEWGEGWGIKGLEGRGGCV